MDITYHPTYREDAQDPVFYAGTFDSVATVTSGTRTFTIVVCGETKVYVWADEIDKAGEEEPIATVRSGDEWAEVGILTDAALYAAEDRIEWLNNSWYEVRASDTEDEDAFDGNVYHSVSDAITDIETALA